MIRARLNPATPPEIAAKPVAGVLLPLPLAGAYDYKLPAGNNAPRGSLVAAPLGNREVLGVVWGAAEGTVGDNRLKIAEPLEGAPALPAKLCDFVDWVADYTLNPPGAILAMALRSRGAFEPGARLGGGGRRLGAQCHRPGGRCQCFAGGGARIDSSGRVDCDRAAGISSF